MLKGWSGPEQKQQGTSKGEGGRMGDRRKDQMKFSKMQELAYQFLHTIGEQVRK
jgi:hypothetical protein